MSDVNYYTENSDVTLLGARGSGEADWRPGQAGEGERVAMGDGQGNGWLVYFLGPYLIVEVWAGGQWQLTRTLDCTVLRQVRGTRHRHTLGFGYDLTQGLLSLGIVSRDADNPADARSAYGEWSIPNLGFVFAHPPVISLGVVPVKLPSGVQYRTLGARLRSVAGRVASRAYLTRGELARLSGRERRNA